MKNVLVIIALVIFSPPAHALEILEDIRIGVGIELGYGVRELESLPPARLRDAEVAAATGSFKLTLETVEKFNVFLALGKAIEYIEYIESVEKTRVIGKDGKLVELGFKWCSPITDVGIPVEGMRIGISYGYQIIMSGIEKRIRGNVTELLHPDSEIEMQKHEFSLFISEDLGFLTLYVGGRYSDILDMEIEIPGEPVIDFVAKEKAGVVIGADIPLGDPLADILPLPIDINLNFEMEALHEASIRFGGSIIF